MISAIAAMSQNRVIGRDGKMPWYLPGDLRRFKELTWGSTVVMGRKTFESIGKPLPGRNNVVLSRSQVSDPRVEHLTSEKEVLDRYSQFFVVGGEQIYRLFFPRVSIVYLTVVPITVEGDSYFPVFEDGFNETKSELFSDHEFRVYERKT